MGILNSINSPLDIKALDKKELGVLCGEIREMLINEIAEIGGHLSSNLGVVELTAALHRIYDTNRDRLIFDVGHQSYVHKILTGRREAFSTLRSMGGISGFPKPSESIHDAFIAGHASNSISIALGMARARSAKGGDYDIAAIIGDGALTGGLAYEGLSNAGQSGEPLVVILNDNGMSIKQNVGGIANLLARQRVKPGYLSFKRIYRRVVGRVPAIYNLFHRIKEFIKSMLFTPTMFEELGFYYMGPVFGNDVLKLEAQIKWARELRCPVLLHVITKKGKGCKFAEENPEVYHGVGTYNPETGELASTKRDFSSVFGEELTRLAASDESLFAITAAMEGGTGLSQFNRKFPDRFFDVGIAEGHAVSMAAGMAKQGGRPVFAVYSSFLQRSYDMLVHDVALQNLHVVVAVDRAGLVGRDGETHHGVFDVSFLASVPDMTVFCPSSFSELEDMLTMALYETAGPVALRYPKGGEGLYTGNSSGEKVASIGDDGAAAIVTYGILVGEALEAMRILSAEGIKTKVIKLNVVSPLHTAEIFRALGSAEALVVVEDCCSGGCVGERLLAALALEMRTPVAARLLNLGNGIVTHGEITQLWSMYGIDSKGIAGAVIGLLRGSEAEGEEAKT